MLGVTKEVPKMADYYLKTDNIMKNMFTVALKDELAAPVSYTHLTLPTIRLV